MLWEFICTLLNDRGVSIIQAALIRFIPTATSCRYHTAAVSVTMCTKDEAILSHVITHCSQTNWASTLHLKTASNSLHLCLSLSLSPLVLCHHHPPPLPFPWKCQAESLFAVIRGSATFNQPLSQMSPNTLFISGLTRDKHAAGGLLTHPTRGVI